MTYKPKVLDIPSGGTDQVSFTAYTPICGGATSTGALQSVASIGSMGDIFMSNGPGVLPSFQANPAGVVDSVTGTAARISVTGTAADPIVDIDSSYVGQSSITTLGTITTGTWSATAIGATVGGTAQTSYTTGDILYASATNTLAKLAIGTTDYVLTVVAGTPAWAPATGGAGLTWNEETGASVSAAVGNGYITNNGAGVTVNLPGTFAVGDTVRVLGKAGLWVIDLPAGDTIVYGDSTTTAGGTLTATNAGDAIELIGIVANDTWRAASIVGSLTGA